MGPDTPKARANGPLAKGIVMSLAAQKKNSTSCSTAKLLAEFEQDNRAKAKARPDLVLEYTYTATEFWRALRVHIDECSVCREHAPEGKGRAA